MRRIAMALALFFASLAIASCDYPVVTSIIEVAFGATGEPHLAVNRLQVHQYFVEGNASLYGFAFASRAAPGRDWEHANVTAMSASAGGALVVGLDGRDYIAFQDGGEIKIQSRLAGPWMPIELGSGVSPAAFTVSPQSTAINAAWTGTDGIVRFVFGSVLLEIESTTAMRAITIPHDCSREVLHSWNTDVLPTGNRSADVVVFDRQDFAHAHTHLATLSCTASSCSFQDPASSDFIAAAGVNDIRSCSFFHLTNGTPTLACTYEPLAGGHLVVIVSTPGHELFQLSDTWLIGAAPTRDGGFALAVGPPGLQTGSVLADFVDAAGHERRFEIEQKQPEDVMTFAAPPGLTEEAVDLFVARGNAVSRVRVRVANGETQRDDVPLGD